MKPVVPLKEMLGGRPVLIFDLFHTLTSVEAAAPGRPTTSEVLGIDRKEWNRQLLEHSRERLTGELKDPIVMIGRMAHAVDPGIPMDLIEKATLNRRENFETTLARPPETTLRVLAELRKRGKRLGLLSNADVLEASGWPRSPLAPFFESAVFSCDVGFAKPDREIYEISLERLGEPPGNCVFIGDGGSDELRGAREAGLATVLMTGYIRALYPGRVEEGRRYADQVIDSLEELLC